MGDSKKIVFKIVADFLIVCLLGLPILIVQIVEVPIHIQGFFCNDQSLKYPYYNVAEPVPDSINIAYSIGIPIIIILIVEIIDAKFNKHHITKNLSIGTWDVPLWLQNSYRHIGFFAFGAACSQITTDMMKYSVGRLRPNFFDVCAVSVDCSDPKNIGKYITEYYCRGTTYKTWYIRHLRLSFPSGHASLAGFTLIYCALYLQVRMTWNGSVVFKHAIQFLLILLTWYTGLTRVQDYTHHWTDVLAGFFLGISYAFLVAKFVSKLFEKKSKNGEVLPDVRYDLGLSTNTR